MLQRLWSWVLRCLAVGGNERVTRIAILGWGSLIWDQRDLPTNGGWSESGPTLPLEFSRKSSDGRLTLVIDTEHGRDLPTRYSESARADVEDAVCDLMHREGTNRGNIGRVNRSAACPADPIEARIWRWAVDHNFDFVLWTKLEPKIPEDWGEFSVQRAETYLRGLPRVCRGRAREYIVNAPTEVKTPLREHIREWLKES